MSDGIFYWWLQGAVMDRRSLLSLLVGVALGWTGATVVGGGRSSDEESDPDAEETRPTEVASPAESSPTAEPSTETETEAAPVDPTSTETETETPASQTRTAEATTNAELQRNLDVHSRGFADDDAYRVLYSIGNENDVAVSVTFEATVSLQNGSELRSERTATIEPGQAATDEFVFDQYESSPTGYGFRPLRTVEA